MKSEKNIFIAFLLNFLFSLFEVIGGFITGSIAILTDALHDICDALSIGISWFFEKKSKRKPDKAYTFGYGRYSAIGSIITTSILLIGSAIVIYNSVIRIITPSEIHYNKMIVFAIIGVVVNLCAALFTHNGHSLNQKAVYLHMLEDVLGWITVLIGAIVMKFTNFVLIDPIISICVAVFIMYHSFKNLKETSYIFLEKVPDGIDVDKIKEEILKIDGVSDVHSIHIWSIDGYNSIATMHIVSDIDFMICKKIIKEELLIHGIRDATLEFEKIDEVCSDKYINESQDESKFMKNNHHRCHNGHHH